MDLQLKDKIAIVMASSEGLGKATALEFAKEGAHVYISSRDENALEQSVKEIKELSQNDHVYYGVCDVTDEDAIKKFVRDVAQTSGTIDILINNAGGPPAGGFDQFSDDDWQDAFELNLLSYVRLIREVLPYMRKKNSGRIVNIASSSIKQTIDNLILSNTFRVGIVGLAKSLSQELAPNNIMINTVGPGRIGTKRVEHLDRVRAEKLKISADEVREQSEAQIPIGRYGLPEEFAKMIVFLSSGANTYVTGQSLVVDGGLVKAL